MLLESNPNITIKDGIYQNANEIFRDSKLSNYIQIAVADVFASAGDKSLYSLDIEKLCNTAELEQVLSGHQFSFLQSCDFSSINTVLDLSEDFGGVAHYVADLVGQVESVKTDPSKTFLASQRCANKQNVKHISADLGRLNFPQRHYDLILIGELEALQLDTQTLSSVLAKLQAALSPNGVLLVNVINSERLSKWFNPESLAPDCDLAYRDLYLSDRDSVEPSQQTVSELNRKQWRDVLLSNNFSAIDIHANFSIGKRCDALFSEDYLTAGVNALNHFYRLGSINHAQINEYLLYQKLVADKRNLVDFANRYILLAGSSTKNTRRFYDNDFSHFPGQGRKPEWRSVTTRRRSAHKVHKESAYPDLASQSDLIQQNLDAQPFHKGRALVSDWLNALLRNDHQGFETLVEEYAVWLNQLAKQKDFVKTAYDLLPFNILIAERKGQREYLSIDTEWQINIPFTADFVLFRALFWFAFENKTILKAFCHQHDIFSLGMFVVHHMPSLHTIEDLNSFIELEERIQTEIDNNFRANAVKHAALQSFDHQELQNEGEPYAQLAWSNKQGVVDEENAEVVTWQKTSELQTINITVPGFSASKPVLRFDPMASSGTFSFDSLYLFDKQGALLWSLESAKNIHDKADSSATQLVDNRFIALNQDPYFLFDLSDIAKIERATKLQVTLAWHWGTSYSAEVNSLSKTITNQNTAIIQQSHRLNQYRADIEFKQQRVEDLLGHRSDLTSMLSEKDVRVQNLNAEINQLKQRLHAQHVRNDELHGYLLMRPSTRFKRVARRWLNRVSGKPMITPPTDAQVEQSNTETSPLPTGELIGQNTEDYALWVRENTLSEKEVQAAKDAISAMPSKPTFSILVPIYNTDPEYLLPMIESVQNQIYPHWQLCLVDDCSPKTYLKRILEHEALQDERISIQLNDINQGISVTTNDALAMAKGDYIALLDHDDEISIDALYENAKVINATPEAGLIYSDEDKMDMQGGRLEPFFKPDYSPDLLQTNNYICHFTVIKKSIVEEIGGFREGLDGSQDHDIIIRAAAATEKVVHIPKILYHWRKIPGSTAVTYDSKSYAWEAGRKAIEDQLQKDETGVRVEFGSMKGTYRVFREIKGNPLVSIVIPFKDKPELLDSCLNSILNRSSYNNFEIVGVSNNSEQELTHQRMEHFAAHDSRIRFVEKNIPFNFSAICNYGVEQAKGDYLILLNNDIEIISPDWIERMLEHAQRDEIGAVGGKLLYPDGRIQHAGVVAGMVGAAGHPHKFFPDDHIGYHGRLQMVFNTSAITGAMMMMKTDKFKAAGGFDEANLAVAYNDIDLCLKLLDQGYYNVFTPHCRATHHESISRGYEDTDEKMQRLLKEQAYFLSKWADFLEAGDPYYNPNLSLKNERFSLKFKD